MLLIFLVCNLFLFTVGQRVNDDWVDPYDMLHYDASTKTMRKPAEPASYTNVVTKRREYVEEPSQAELASCKEQVVDLQRKVEDLNKQPTCNPVFKRFLSRLLKEIRRVGAPSDSTEIFYDAKIKLSRQAMVEIESLLDGEDRWRTGALDNAVSQILIDLKPHDYEAWKWHFEDTFGVELDTVLKIGGFVLIISTIICTQMWSKVSWFVQFTRLFAICFFVSIVWNWFYLYKIAFAERQNNMAKMDSVHGKCTGVKKIDWTDSLKEWYRSTWTLQDDPCKKYYEILIVDPFLEVPPSKAISLTITTFITEPMKHIGQGISEFLRALLKDLPVTLQIPVLLTIVLAILVVMYGSVQAAFRYGIMAPLRQPRRDPPPPELQQPQHRPLMVEGQHNLAGGDAPAPAPAPAPQRVPQHRAHDARLHRNNVHQRRPDRVREGPPPMVVETLRRAEPCYSGDEIDAEQHEESPETAENLSEQSESENQPETQVEADGASAHSDTANAVQSKPERTESDLSQSKNKPLKRKERLSKNEPKKDGAAARSEPAGRETSQRDVPDPEASGEETTSPVLQRVVETVGHPVQETCPAEVE